MTQIDSAIATNAVFVRQSDPLDLPSLVGQWQLSELVSEGTLARIYRARCIGTSDDQPAPYALKILKPEHTDDVRAVDMMRHEAFVGQTVRNQHLIPILSSNVRQPPYFIVTPWLDGATLESCLSSKATLDLPVVLWIARQVAEALEALHDAGWMHSDIKPSNIFVSHEGHVTLLDLGFAHKSHEPGSAVERCFAGTCNYIAPETITSSLRSDIRSDIYSLGVVLFEALSGRLPFESDDLADLASQHVNGAPPDLRQLCPHLSTDTVSMVRQMIAKDPLRRPQSPRELVDRLANLEILTFAERAWE